MLGHQLLLPVPDLERTKYFLILGANPAVSNGSMMTAPGMSRRLEEIRRRGGKVVLVDPRYNETAPLVDRHLFIRPGTDVLLLLALLQVAAPFLLISYGERHISSSLTAILISVVPIYTTLLAMRFDHAERARGWGLVGIVTGIAGVVLLFGVMAAGQRR